MTDTVRYWIAGILMTAGLLFAAVSILGVFRFRFVMNRMHCAAILDTLLTRWSDQGYVFETVDGLFR